MRLFPILCVLVLMLSSCSILADRQVFLLRQQLSDVKAAADATKANPSIAPYTIDAIIAIASQMDNQLTDGSPAPTARQSKADWMLDAPGSLGQTKANLQSDAKEWESSSIVGVGAIIVAALGALLRYGKYIPGPIGNVMSIFDGMIGGSDPRKTKLLSSLHSTLDKFREKQPNNEIWAHLSENLSENDKVTVRKMRKK